MFMFVFIAPDDLATNLAQREFAGVDIAIGGVGLEGRDQSVEVASIYVLGGGDWFPRTMPPMSSTRM